MNNHHLIPTSQELRRISKKEKYLLRKEQKEQKRLRSIRRKKLRKIMMISIPLILLVGGVIFGLMNYSPKENQGTPKIEIIPQEYDAGTVSMVAGLVKHTYEIKNNGDGNLKIDRIWTSCMCTTIRLKVGDETSPEFGMHSNPVFWSQKITPGETGFLEVTFDPAFHGVQGVGELVRVVYVSSNDPQNQKTEARMLINVAP